MKFITALLLVVTFLSSTLALKFDEDVLNNTADSYADGMSIDLAKTTDDSKTLKKFSLRGSESQTDNAYVSTTRASSRAVYCVNKCIGRVAYAECVEDCLSNTAISVVEVETTVNKSSESKKLNLGGNREIDNAQVSTTRTTNDPVVICVNKCIPYRAFEACVDECLSSNAISDLADEATSVKSLKSKLDFEVHDNAQVSTK
eukprot:scaffold47634_cov32-Cyclotella_meneghiniana.AAC.1